MAAVAESKITLSYPLYACDFDPEDPNRLVVAGGGGSSRSGVGNKISVLDTSIRDDLRLAGELDLSPDEDNVTTIAFGHTTGKATALYAGVNSSPAEVEKGKNEHLRTFAIDVPSSPSASSTTSSVTSIATTAASSAPETPRRRASTAAALAAAAASSIASPLRSPKVTEVARTPLFQTKDKDAYQRLLRLPPPPTTGPSLVGAAASAFARDPEIAVFETAPTTSTSPSSPGPAVRPRGRLALGREAMDLDVIQTAEDTYQLAHCDAHDLYLFTIAKAGAPDAASLVSAPSSGPECVYTIPHDESSGSPDPNARPAFRSIRYLTSGFLLAVSNMPRRQGAILQGLRLPAASVGTGAHPDAESPVDEDTCKARLSVSRRLPKSVAQATGLAVRNINPPTHPGATAGDTQFIIAVAGHDASISLFTLDHTASNPANSSTNGIRGVELLSNLLPFATLASIHPTHITGLSFSVFQPPPIPSSSRYNSIAKRPAPVVKLASVSVGNTAVVHAIPLRSVPEYRNPVGAIDPSDGAFKQQRYIVAIPPKKEKPVRIIMYMSFLVLLMAMAAQSYLKSRGYTIMALGGARDLLPHSVGGHVNQAQDHVGFLDRLIKDIEGMAVDMTAFHGPESSKLILRGEAPIRADPDPDNADEEALPELGLKVEVQENDNSGNAREWDELETPEKEAWKEKLKRSGHWIEDMGETVFKGVLFGEIGGFVGNVMAAGAGM